MGPHLRITEQQSKFNKNMEGCLEAKKVKNHWLSWCQVKAVGQYPILPYPVFSTLWPPPCLLVNSWGEKGSPAVQATPAGRHALATTPLTRPGSVGGCKKTCLQQSVLLGGEGQLAQWLPGVGEGSSGGSSQRSSHRWYWGAGTSVGHKMGGGELLPPHIGAGWHSTQCSHRAVCCGYIYLQPICKPWFLLGAKESNPIEESGLHSITMIIML